MYVEIKDKLNKEGWWAQSSQKALIIIIIIMIVIYLPKNGITIKQWVPVSKTQAYKRC